MPGQLGRLDGVDQLLHREDRRVSVPCAPDDDGEHRARASRRARRRPECRSRRPIRPAPSARRSAFCPRVRGGGADGERRMRVAARAEPSRAPRRRSLTDASTPTHAAMSSCAQLYNGSRSCNIVARLPPVKTASLYINGEFVAPSRIGDARRHRSVDARRSSRACPTPARPTSTAPSQAARARVRRRPVEGRDRAGPRPRAVQARRDRPRPRRRAGRARDAQHRQADRRSRVRHRRRRDLLRVLRRPGDEDSRRRHPGARQRDEPRAARADRRRRADHPVELSAADGGVEARAGDLRRLHDGAEAGRADAADRARARVELRRRRACRPASSTSSPASARPPARRSSRIPTSTRSRSPAAPRSARSSCAAPPTR